MEQTPAPEAKQLGAPLLGRASVPENGASVAALAHFASPGPLTELGVHAAFARALPDALPDLCRVVQSAFLGGKRVKLAAGVAN